ncbi:MAG: hypothetical protein EBT07_19265, partial [Actinobacteria bacterium]|nr:hypothetical protein [Actinomycetota bacterium]
FGSGNDLATFSGALGAASIFGGDGADTLLFTSSLSGTSLQGGAGNDQFLGSVTIGSGGVSFWGGTGNDTFNFTTITNSGNGGTAYFWNEAGTDSIVFGSVVSSTGQMGAVARFGITIGSSLDISFAGTQNVTSAYGGGTLSNAFSVASTLVTFGASGLGTTLVFAGGEVITLRGAIGTTNSSITNAFANAKPGIIGTANFGIASAIPTFS